MDGLISWINQVLGGVIGVLSAVLAGVCTIVAVVLFIRIVVIAKKGGGFKDKKMGEYAVSLIIVVLLGLIGVGGVFKLGGMVKPDEGILPTDTNVPRVGSAPVTVQWDNPTSLQL